jgi:hypothetical protein
MLGLGRVQLQTRLEVASPASTPAVLRISSNKTGTGAGDKSRLEFYSADNSGTAYETGYMVYDRADTTGTASYVAWASRVAGTVAERMRISSIGDLLVNTTSNLGSARFVVEQDTTTANPMVVSNPRSTAATDYSILFYRNSSIVGSVQTSLSATSYVTSSDYRLKTDAQPMTGASARVQALKPVNFEWISTGERVDGFLAHEAQEIVPEAVTGTKDAMREEEYEVTAAIEATYDEDGNELTAAVEAVMGTRSARLPRH